MCLGAKRRERKTPVVSTLISLPLPPSLRERVSVDFPDPLQEIKNEGKYYYRTNLSTLDSEENIDQHEVVR